MNLATAPDKARELGDGAGTSAARLYNSIEHELELGNYTEDQADAGEEALSILESRFPGVRQAARSSTEPPALSHSAGANLRRGDGSAGNGNGRHAGGRDRAPRRGTSHSGSGGPRRSSSGPRRSGGFSGRRVVERAAGVSGEDVAGSIITGLQFLLAGGLAYFVLTPKGSRAFSTALGGVGKGVSLLVDPVDPLGGRKTSSASSPAPAPTPITARANAGLNNPFPNPPVPVQTPALPGPESSTGAAPGGPFADPFLNPLAPILPRTPSPFGAQRSSVRQPASPLALSSMHGIGQAWLGQAENNIAGALRGLKIGG